MTDWNNWGNVKNYFKDAINLNKQKLKNLEVKIDIFNEKNMELIRLQKREIILLEEYIQHFEKEDKRKQELISMYELKIELYKKDLIKYMKFEEDNEKESYEPIYHRIPCSTPHPNPDELLKNID